MALVLWPPAAGAQARPLFRALELGPPKRGQRATPALTPHLQPLGPPLLSSPCPGIPAALGGAAHVGGLMFLKQWKIDRKMR